MVCDEDVCERWCVTKMCAKDGVRDGVCDKDVCDRKVCDKDVCDKDVCEKMVSTMVCDKDVCEKWCKKDGV